LKHPLITILIFFIIIGFFAYHAKNFRIDASSETLLNENDRELSYYRSISKKYQSKDFIVITYRPYSGDLFSKQTLADISKLRDELKSIEDFETVTTILDIPLFDTTYKTESKNSKSSVDKFITLETEGVNIDFVKDELKTSPLYQNLIVSPDLKATAIQVILKPHTKYSELVEKQDAFQDKMRKGSLSQYEKEEYKKLKKDIRGAVDQINDQTHQNILKIRSIVKKYEKNADIILGGIPLIADDLIGFIKSDLDIFGIGVFLFIIITLFISFRNVVWVLFPAISCFLSVIIMIGILGLFDWKVTVISSNFVSLQLILTMSIAIHLIVKYQEIEQQYPSYKNITLVRETVKDRFIPCVYTTLTTIAGFSSLVLCDLKPVRTFGWMMSIGLIVSMIVTFIFFPASISLFKNRIVTKSGSSSNIDLMPKLPHLILDHTKKIIYISLIIVIISVIGFSKLKVENSFIDYFKHTTEIYKGLKFIDQNLGGTTSFDVVVNFPEEKKATKEIKEDDDSLFKEFDESDDSNPEYWLTTNKLELIKKVDDYLSALPHVGKVLSLETIMKIAEKFNDGRKLDNFELAVFYKQLPEKERSLIIDPYISIKDNEAHITGRVKDSDKDLRRNDLLKSMKDGLENKVGIKRDMFNITGIFVLYNNILQSLFESQILTLGLTALLLMLMFMILFKSWKIALVTIFPNVIPIIFFLGFMGWAGIPLDMMTITIAAISMGIAVDDAIHYVHRFREEFHRSRSYRGSILICGKSVAYAMLYTTIVITAGFSILVFSNFIPTIYFGLLTGLAMVIALIVNLLLLPSMILMFKPFGKEQTL